MKFDVTNGHLVSFEGELGRLTAFGDNAVKFQEKYGQRGEMNLPYSEIISILRSYSLNII